MTKPLSIGPAWPTGIACAAAATIALTVNAQGQPAQPGGARANVSLAGIPVAGKTREEVDRLAHELAARLVSYPVTFKHAKRSERTSPKQVGASVDTAAAVDGVFAPPAGEGLLEKIRERFSGPDAVDVALAVHVPEDGLHRALARFSLRIGTDPRDARLTSVRGRLTAIPPKLGKELDFTAAASALQSALDAVGFRARIKDSLDAESDRAAWLNEQKPIEIPAALREARPRITLDMLEPITRTLASFSTGLGGSSRNRVHNVELACNAIDGTVLLPGDVFSYNDTVGPRVPSAGFREAPVIIRGELQKGTGGGICQVSSTLYNAALLSDMEIVRRSHHAFPVHYLPAGRDATVVDGAIDFRFKNRLEHPVAIDAKVIRRKVVVQVYGHPDDRRQVTLLSSGFSRVPASLTTVSDSRLPRGKRVVDKKAKPGRRVTLTRVVKKDGELLRREVVSRDFYRPFSGVIRVGTAELRKPSPPAATAGRGPEPPAPPAPGDIIQ